MKYIFFLFFLILIFSSGFKLFDKEIVLKLDKFPFFEINKKLYFSKEQLKNKEGLLATTIIIGSGPAGLSSALYVARLYGKEAKVIVISGDQPGGQLTGTGIVENWPGVIPTDGPILMNNLIKQIEELGVIFINGKVIEINKNKYPYEIKLENGEILYTYSIIIASGSSPKKLNCKGEDEYWGKGVSTCAICDAPMYKNKKVVVIGGGDSACEEAIQLSEYAESVFIFVRGEKMRASKIMQERILNNKKIKIFYNTSIKEIIGNNEKVKSIIYINSEKKEILINIDGVFIAIGHSPNNNFFKNFIILNDNGLIICKKRTQETNVEGIFAAGDIVEGEYKQAGTAAGDGIKAGIEAYRFLQNLGITSKIISENENIWYLKKNNFQSNCKDGVCSIEHIIYENTDIKEIKNEIKKFEKNWIKINSMKEYFEIFETMKNKNEKYLIKISTKTCPSCLILKKNLEEYVEKNKDLIKIYSINLDEISGAFDYFYDIKSVPVLFLMNGKNELKRKIGSMNINEINNFINK